MQNHILVLLNKVLLMAIAITCSSVFATESVDSVMAKMCFLRENRTWMVPRDTIWILVAHEQVTQLNITVKEDAEKYRDWLKYNLFVPIQNDSRLLLLGGGCFVNHISQGKPLHTERCESDKKHDYDVYSLFVFEFEKNDSLQLVQLVGKSYPLHWELNFNMGSQKQKIVGDNTVYISGFCTDEQLKTIQERKKKRENTPSLP